MRGKKKEEKRRSERRLFLTDGSALQCPLAAPLQALIRMGKKKRKGKGKRE